MSRKRAPGWCFENTSCKLYLLDCPDVLSFTEFECVVMTLDDCKGRLIPLYNDAQQLVGAMMLTPNLEVFKLDGYIYEQQYRRCGNSECSCSVYKEVHFGHGPYWWRRNAAGKRCYLGSDLPRDVALWRDELLKVDQHQSDLEDRLMALSRLKQGQALTERDKALLREMGYSF